MKSSFFIKVHINLTLILCNHFSGFIGEEPLSFIIPIICWIPLSPPYPCWHLLALVDWMCVLWLPISVPWIRYEVVGFQPQEKSALKHLHQILGHISTISLLDQDIANVWEDIEIIKYPDHFSHHAIFLP